MEDTMDRKQSILILLFSLTTTVKASVPQPKIWLGLGTEQRSNNLPITPDLSSSFPLAKLLNHYSLSFPRQNLFWTVEIEQPIDSQFSASLKGNFSNNDKSVFRPFFNELSSNFIEISGKYRSNKTIYGLGLGVQKQQFSASNPSPHPEILTLSGYSPAVSFSAEILSDLNIKASLGFTAFATTLVKPTTYINDMPLNLSAANMSNESINYSTSVAVLYNLNTN